MTDHAPRPPAEGVGAAFRELHGPRLHGFALLLTLGDRSEAAALTSEALAAGIARIEALRHPERAAAWLRRRVVDGAAGSRPSVEGEAILAELGADSPLVHALGALDRLERAALLASTVERLDRRDVATIVGRDGDRLDRLIRTARRRFADAYAAPEDANGPIVSHLHDVAHGALA